MSELTVEHMWEYLREKWPVVYFREGRIYAPQPNGSEAILSGNPRIPLNEKPAVQAAYDFTVQREEEIRKAEEGINWLNTIEIRPPDDGSLAHRILAREQSALAEIRKGMR